jgi:hypothetical protein
MRDVMTASIGQHEHEGGADAAGCRWQSTHAWCIARRGEASSTGQSGTPLATTKHRASPGAPSAGGIVIGTRLA